MRLRAAVADDAADIARVESAAASHPWSPAAVSSTLALPTTVAVLACDPQVVGHILASGVLDEGEVLTVAVDPEHRRRGIGRALMLACEEQWRARGVRRGFLDVRADNRAAISLYLALGWKREGVRARYYADGTDALQLTREIA